VGFRQGTRRRDGRHNWLYRLVSAAPCVRGPVLSSWLNLCYATSPWRRRKRLILELLRERWSYLTMVHERQWEAAVATVMWPTRPCFRTGRRVSDRGSGCGLPPPERRHGSELWRRTWLGLPPERSLRDIPQLVTANHTKRPCFIAFSWPSASSPHLCPVAICCDPLDSRFASESCKLVVAADLPGSASHSLEEYCV
jgi:hypothetical protein